MLCPALVLPWGWHSCQVKQEAPMCQQQHCPCRHSLGDNVDALELEGHFKGHLVQLPAVNGDTHGDTHSFISVQSPSPALGCCLSPPAPATS